MYNRFWLLISLLSGLAQAAPVDTICMQLYVAEGQPARIAQAYCLQGFDGMGSCMKHYVKEGLKARFAQAYCMEGYPGIGECMQIYINEGLEARFAQAYCMEQ